MRLVHRLAPARDALILLVGEGAARLLSFVFYIAAARALSPDGFGVVRYSIVVATMGAAALSVFAAAVTRDLGAHRASEDVRRRVAGLVLAGAGVLSVASVAVLVLAAAAGVTGSADVLGTAWAIVGFGALQIYYGACRGLGRTLRAALVYGLASGVQIVAWLVAVAAGHASVGVALAIYGLSSVVVVAAVEAVRPLLLRGPRRPDGDDVRRVRAIAAPLFVSNALFLVWSSIDQLWVEGALGATAVGIYGAARNTAQLLAVIPLGLASYALPQVAHLVGSGRRGEVPRFVLRLLAATLAVNGVVAAGVAWRAGDVLELLYGAEYADGDGVLRILCLGVVGFSGFAIVTASGIGAGAPRVHLWATASGLALAGVLILLAAPSIEAAAWIAITTQVVATAVAAVVLASALRRAAPG